MTQSGAAAARPGKVYLVGAGPGDPGLITLRGKRLLERAQVVVYDYLANPRLLAHVPPGAELIYAGKKGGGLHAFTQEEINELLIDRALAGRVVVRLKGGDPFIFGRGAEEIEAITARGIPFEVVPGVTSATAAATYAGIPITHRDYTASVAFITGHESPAKTESAVAWDKLATGAGTLVIYMGIKNLPRITARLMEHGRSPDTPVAVVRWASTPRQRSVTGTLATITEVVRQEGIRPPALVVVGEVVSLRERIDWFEHRPLFGRRIVVTRTREHAGELSALLEEQGADCREHATIHIEPVEDPGPLDAALGRLGDYDWVLFTSLNAVRYFFQGLDQRDMDSRALAGVRIGVVGRATAEALAGYGLRADLVPEEFTGEGLAAALEREGVSGSRILLPRAEKAREVLPQTLEGAGAQVEVVPVYRNVPPRGRKEDLRQEFTGGKVDMVTFTSSSTVTNFLTMLDPASPGELAELMRGVHVAAIGPITARTVREAGLEVHVQPASHTIADMVDAIVDYYTGRVD